MVNTFDKLARAKRSLVQIPGWVGLKVNEYTGISINQSIKNLSEQMQKHCSHCTSIGVGYMWRWGHAYWLFG